MQYRMLGRTGIRVSEVSLGTEYLINLPKRRVTKVIRTAIEHGVNYFDLFFAQPAFRDNMGEAFRGRRDDAILTVHLGSIDRDGQYAKTRDVKLAVEFFEDALRRYRVDHFDVCFLHNSDGAKDYRDVTRPGGLLETARRLVDEGKARFVGFSSHTVATALEAVESGAVDVLMFPVSLAGNAVPGKRDLFRMCAARDVGLVAMKVYAGGKLLAPQDTLELDKWLLGGRKRKVRRNAAEGARGAGLTPVQCISYALSQPGVSTVVPGCKDTRELAAALAYCSAPEGEKRFAEALREFSQYTAGECVYCNHCLPCPSRIDIGAVMRELDAVQRGKGAQAIRPRARKVLAAAGECIECGACVSRCPFGANPMKRIARAASLGRGAK